MRRSSFIPNRTWLKKRSRAPAYTSHLVTVPAGYNLLACLTFFGCSPVTRVELELNLGVKVYLFIQHLLARPKTANKHERSGDSQPRQAKREKKERCCQRVVTCWRGDQVIWAPRTT